VDAPGDGGLEIARKEAYSLEPWSMIKDSFRDGGKKGHGGDLGLVYSGDRRRFAVTNGAGLLAARFPAVKQSNLLLRGGPVPCERGSPAP